MYRTPPAGITREQMESLDVAAECAPRPPRQTPRPAYDPTEDPWSPAYRDPRTWAGIPAVLDDDQWERWTAED